MKVVHPTSPRKIFIITSKDSYGHTVELAIVKDDLGRVDLTGYSVELIVEELDGDRVFTKPLTITNASEGLISYTQDRDDFPEEGVYLAKIRFYNASQSIETRRFPIVVM